MSAQEPPVPPAVAAEVLASRDRSIDLHRRQSHDRHSLASVPSGTKTQGFRAGVGLGNVARRTLGIFLLLVTVGLWTSSNFLTSVRNPHLLSPPVTFADICGSISSPIIHTPNRTSSHISTRRSLPYH